MVVEQVAVYGALLGITALNVGVYLKVGSHSAKIKTMADKVTSLNGNLEDIKNVLIRLPCIDYNGKLKVNKDFHIEEDKN